MSQKANQLRSLGHVLVVGGCGFLGHHIVALLHSRHPLTQITVLDISTKHNRIEASTISYQDADITNIEALKSLFERLKPEVVIHTASPHPDANKTLLYTVNVDGTSNLLQASKDVGVKVFVYTSSASVVMDKEGNLINADERWPVVMGSEQPEYYTTTKVGYSLSRKVQDSVKGTSH